MSATCRTIALALLTASLISAGCSGTGPTTVDTGPRNVILIVPDGCSPNIWAAVRAMTVGITGSLEVDRLPVQGRCRTYAADDIITDSAAGGTAFATGHKTNNGVLSMDAATVRGDSLTGSVMPTLFEQARDAGLATGLVSTAMIQHATPAAFYTHRADRGWYELITNDMTVSGADILMGGGRQYCIPNGTVGLEGTTSSRTDGRDILAEMRAAGYTVVEDQAGFDALDPAATVKLCGIFNGGHMQYEVDRAGDRAGEPSISEMTAMALDILSRDPDGFFIMIEAARIDHAGHDHDTERMLGDAAACDEAVGVAAEFARNNPGTLLVVVPDHGTGGPHFIGMEGSGDDRAGFDAPSGPEGNPVAIRWIEPTGHTGEDVSIHAMGPGSKALGGLVDNTEVYRVLVRHLGFAAD